MERMRTANFICRRKACFRRAASLSRAVRETPFYNSIAAAVNELDNITLSVAEIVVGGEA